MDTPQNPRTNEALTPAEQTPVGVEQRPMVIAIMWAIVGALGSGGGAVVGFFGGVAASTSCVGDWCGFSGAAGGVLKGWGIGAAIMIAASVLNGGGTAIDKSARAVSTIFGVVALPGVFWLLSSI